MVIQSFLSKKCGVTIKQALKINPDLIAYMTPNGLDIGNTKALLLYNKLILKEFMDLEFDLPNGYLIPTICSRWAFLKHILQFKPNKVLEIGTGASAILALMLGRVGISITATEIDNTAFQSALSNIKKNKLCERINLLKSDHQLLLDFIPQLDDYDLILCNPPQYNEDYFQEHKFSSRGFMGSQSELVGGKLGHEFIISLLSEARMFINPPPVFFQLTLPKLKDILEKELERQNFHYYVTPKKIGTRKRLYYQVKLS